MKKHRVGLDISDHKVRLVGIGQSYRRLHMQMFAEADVPPGAIVNGNIVQPDTVIATLRELAKQHTSFPWHGHEVYLGLPEQHTFMSAIWLNNGGKDKADAEREARKILPIEPDQMYYDVQIQRSSKLACLAASQRVVVDHYLEVMKAANFSILGIHSEAEAVAKALIPVTDEPTGYIIIDLGTARTTVAFYIFNAIFFSTTYPSVLVNGGLQQNNLIAVLQQLQQYYNEHFSATVLLTKIILCGSGAYIPNLVDWLKTLTTVPVQTGDPLFYFKPNHISKRLERPLAYTTAIGLALQK